MEITVYITLSLFFLAAEYAVFRFLRIRKVRLSLLIFCLSALAYLFSAVLLFIFTIVLVAGAIHDYILGYAIWFGYLITLPCIFIAGIALVVYLASMFLKQRDRSQ